MDDRPVTEIRYQPGALYGRTCWNMRKTWIFVLSPIILLALPIVIPTQEARCAYVILLMLIYYLTEVIPIPIVALIPLVLFPLLQIVPPKDLTKMYMKEISITVLGSIMVALSIQRWGVPKRLALRVLITLGTDIRRLLFSIMLTTLFLSIWINNSPTAIMMIPIAKSVATEYLKQTSLKDIGDENETHTNGDGPQSHTSWCSQNIGFIIDVASYSTLLFFQCLWRIFQKEEEFEEMNQEKKNVLKMFILSVPWCCNLGGAGSLYGTPVNLLLKANIESAFDDPTTITFVNWFAFSLPCSLIMLGVGWVWLQIYHLGWRNMFACKRKTPLDLQREANLKRIFRNQYAKLGPISFAEYAAVGHMAILAFVWFTMDPGIFPGWGNLFSKRFVSAYPPAILLTISLFVFPSEFPDFLRFWDKKKMVVSHTPAPALMDWKTMNQMFPWTVLLLLGGGTALAGGIKHSGLSVWIAGNLGMIRDLPPYTVVLLSVIFSTFTTEFMSNSALLSIVLPILANLAVKLRMHPLYLMFPASIASVYSFMMPTASSTNAISYSAGVLNIPDMVKPGIVMNLAGIVVIMLAVHTWGTAIFQLHTFPSWASGNGTTINITAFS